MNPNYLKGDRKAKRREPIDDGCEDIPIAELALEVPLHITCESMTLLFLLFRFNYLFSQPPSGRTNIC